MSETVIGRPIDRVDGPQKVTGRAQFAAEFNPPRIVHAVLVQSEVPSGRITRIDAKDARKMNGVLQIITHENAPALPKKGRAAINPPSGRVLSLLQDGEIHYNGEPIAVVVAEQLEQAVDAAEQIRVTYALDAPKLEFEREKARSYAPKKLTLGPTDLSWGEFDAALGAAEVRIDQTYTTSMEHHNPIEPHATVALWEGDQLKLYDSTQHVTGVRQTVAKVLGIPPENVHVICPFVGGGFGCKGSTWSHVVLAAIAARAVKRPVKLVLARPQMFGPVGGRPMTEQHVVLGAHRDGRLTAIRHDVVSHTSFMEDYAEASTQPTRALYACDAGSTTQRLVRLNVGVPTFQRAPGEATGSFAIESAMDELAARLGMDPLALRLANHADIEPSTGKPWTSKRLRDCYRLAAGRFKWSQRNAKPGSMRDGSWLIGWGMATATYPAHRMPAAANAKMLRNGLVVVQSGTQELGTGTYTVMTQVAAETLGVPVGRVRFELGDTTFPVAPISGGSMTASSVGPAVQNACKALREKILAFAAQDSLSPFHGRKKADLSIEDGQVFVASDPSRRQDVAKLLGQREQLLEARGEAAPGEEEEKFASRSFGAVFTEVRVHQDLRMVRVPRVVATYSVGRVMNAKTARSQLQGGIVWGLGEALFERSELDPRYGRFVNGNLAEYHVPANADIGEIDVSLVDESDSVFNPVGGRGIGEIGITGVAASVANAVYHATGTRIRSLPVTLDKLLS